MADSLFDGRYRYDYIYPRGRSGETLRAVDTQDNDRPVVIKRPAPNDAPPIRAGQEVSILNERKALTRLAGHPVLTALLGSGQFSVGSVPHQYIVMERGEGMIVADAVLELAARGERLPHLEMLVIIDHLLDLLHTAHARDIVYNDVDAKHLFWDRDHYRLKVIDWGNAVFLEGDEVTPQGISRQSDILQVGELIYFILSGGGRPDIPRDVDENFRLDFGKDADRVHSRLQGILSRAVHPNLRFRYRTIAELRKDLAEYRAPFERDRDAAVARVTERLRRNLSKNELRGLLGMLEPALAADPGYPPARAAYDEIIDRLRDLEVSADLDAVRIYMESANWSRAGDLLRELREKAGAQTTRLINLLLDFTVLLLDNPLQPMPQAVLEAIQFAFDGEYAYAAQTLMLQETGDDRARTLQWLMAERVSSHVPDVLLLRPNLYRLDLALTALAADGLVVAEPRALLADINHSLDATPGAGGANLAELRDHYRSVVDRLTALLALLERLGAQHTLSNRKLPLNALERALNAAMALADNMHVIGKQATTSPRDALAALDSSRSIDPANPLWDMVSRLLNNLYDLLQSYQVYVPAADGSDLETWLKYSQRDLKPFVDRLFDEMLAGMVAGLEIAEKLWGSYSNAVIQGNRISAITALAQATDAVGTISPTLSGWLNQLRSVVTGAQYVERHAVYGGLGRALADGWEAFDRGRLSDAERLGQQAFEIARSEPERFAARRLRNLSQTARDWVERNGVNSVQRTKTALVAIEELYTTDENTLRDNFAAQMPSKETYLRAMTKGLVEIYARNSTAANRILFFHNVLLGTLDAHDALFEDAEFWREAAVRALGDYGPRHAATRALDEFIERRRDINAAAALLNQVTGSHALATLENTRKQLEDNPQARTLAAAIHSLRELEASLRDWSDGEFRAAGIKIENAINAVNEVEQAAEITLTSYRAWLMDLQAHAAELHNLSRQMRQVIERRAEQPDPVIRDAHRRQVEVTLRVLGQDYAATLRQWRDTYENFVSVYADTTIRRSAKLSRFNELFRAMFIDRHPAYPLYRHWYDLTDNAPEFPAPPTNEPVPRLAESEVQENEYLESRYAEDERSSTAAPRRIPVLAIIGGVGGIILIVLILLAGGVLNPGGIAVTITNTPGSETAEGQTLIASSVTEAATGSTSEAAAPVASPGPQATPSALPVADFNTPTLIPTVPTATWTPSPTHTPTSTNTPLPTFTPTNTNTPTDTHTPTTTYTPTHTPTPTLPPGGLQGQQDLLALFKRLSDYPWDDEQFSLTTALDTSYWRLGVGTARPEGENDTIFITLPLDLLETYYGNNAASRIRRLDAELVFTSYNPGVVAENEVYFGALLQSADEPEKTAGLHVQLARSGVINLAQRSGTTINFLSQRAVNAVIVRLRLERDAETGFVTVFFNDNPLGKPLEFIAPNAPALPVLFVRNGGVILSVTQWKITLR